MLSSCGCGSRSFRFERDTLTFRNELVWEYHFDPVTGAMKVIPNDPPPAYFHRCFVVIKAARQFFYHARFDPAAPRADEEVYRRLIRQVISRNPRRSSAPQDCITISGYDCLRAFSEDHEPLLKAECGGPWQSYFLRSHWRMVFPVSGAHQEAMAHQLGQEVRLGAAPMVHLFRFPRVTINHGILLFGVDVSEKEVRFEAYDPNIPAHPVTLIYDRASKEFRFPSTCYWAGGKVSVVEIFRDGLY